MYSFNQMILIGKARNITSHRTQSGEDLVNCTIQFQNYKNKQTENLYYDCAMFGQNAKHFELYVKEGDVVQVLGKLVYENYKTKDGQDKRRYRIMVDKFLKLRAAYADELKDEEKAKFPKAPATSQIMIDDDEIPF